MNTVATASLALLVVLAGCAPAPEAPAVDRLQVADVLGGIGGPGFERALEPRPFRFPEDHGPHESFAAEWWYFTGNLDADDGRRFGYQLTFFRTSLAATAPARRSAWASNQVWMAHFALTDVDRGRFAAFDRFQRGALGLAGGNAAPWRVWLDDWSLEQTGDAAFPLRLRAGERAGDGGDGGGLTAIDLTVAPAKDVVLQGDRGLSRKGSTPGNASYYYSFTRLVTEGRVSVGGDEHAVAGTSWLDREWSTSALEPGQTGWDWFALQLADRTELMFYRIRQADGSASPQSAGTLVLADGDSVRLTAADVELDVLGAWASPVDGATYPARWRLRVPAHGIDLRVTPVLADQELDLAFRYWEGAVDATGSGVGGAPVDGRGYVELTGYAEGGPPR